MKKIELKSILLGFFIGTIGITTVFATGKIKSANFSSSEVTLDGINLNLNINPKNQLVTIVKDNEQDASLYMPLRGLLQTLGYKVIWNDAEKSVDLISPKPKILINGNTIIKNKDIKIGYGLQVIDLEESTQSGVTWKCIDKSANIKLVKDEYLDTKSKKIHRFSFDISDENHFQTPESRNLTISFEQMLGDKKLDNKITYNLYVSLSGDNSTE